MKKQTSTDFKAVEFMRKRRDALSDLYEKNPSEFWNKLEEVRKKYKKLFHQKGKHAA